jgi:hypothetical protein
MARRPMMKRLRFASLWSRRKAGVSKEPSARVVYVGTKDWIGVGAKKVV